ncbi:Autoinducer 2 sensor kinase/phosphatase LuxQ [Aquisphaera giovannonii]|uniref:histidine kinase n=2 Tax=Aquisphaera giovannonii TaxID=406548 RepID=A0A5B9W5B3_9BACT|nr:Autoinducer 2 sensor kinase/phosphatase LuxQ [Aquisphaera giovannonii]
MPERPPKETRVLLLAPTTKDLSASAALLRAGGIPCHACRDLADACGEIAAGAGALVVPEEAVLGGRGKALARILGEQPAWSSLPTIVLTAAGPDSAAKVRSILELGDVTLLKRPLEVVTFLNAVRAALRDRERQYQVRDHLAEREAVEATLREQDERLRFALAAGRLGSWELDLETGALACSDICRANYGRAPGEALAFDDVLRAIHPEERQRVRDAVAEAGAGRRALDVEYRTVWPDGSTHWVLARGRVDGRGRMSGVSLDITERKEAEEALRDADRKKDDFIAMLAHELRNPLAPIRNGLQVMRLAGGDAHAVARARAMMERQLAHMVRLVDDLLDVSRLSRQKMELRKERVLLADAVNAAVEATRPLMEAAGHELEVSLPPGPIFLDADPTRLSQVFSNLLSNSARYTEPGGRIRLAASRRGGEVAVSVRDNGIGIPREELAGIFEMFSQVDRSLERSHGGLGIGLALVKGLVEMHGGTVAAESEGRGSTFTVRLPLGEAAGKAPAQAVADGDHGPRRVLIADDSRDGAESLAMMLRLLGDEVRTARDGIEAVELAGEFRPEVILMDVGMPRLNGLDATRRIREQDWGRGIAIIALTGWGQDGDRDRSREAGCDGHLVKPVDLPDLERALADATG